METSAAVAFKAGEPLRIETVHLDGPKDGEALVEIKAPGTCHTEEFTLVSRHRQTTWFDGAIRLPKGR